MKHHKFTIRRNIYNFSFLQNLSYKILNVDLNKNKIIQDRDFIYLSNLYELDISECKQETITDGAFEYLKDIHTLNM